MVESAMKHIKILEDLDFDLIKISLKSSDVMTTIEAYRLMAQKTDYPLHLRAISEWNIEKRINKIICRSWNIMAEGIGTLYEFHLQKTL